jgi:cation:H+ antiporter
MMIIRFLFDEALLHHLMADLSTFLLLVIIAVSILVLSKGADWMINGVVQLAQRTGLPRIVISATVVSLGTTTPEAFVSVMAAFMGNAGLALGNGVGSIIADTGLIFGLTCILASVPVYRFILNRMGWVQVGAATLLVVIAAGLKLAADADPHLPRWVGVLFLILLGGYLYLSYKWALQRGAQSEGITADEEHPEVAGSLWLCWVLIVGGLVMVIFAARTLIPAASEIAARFGVPEDVIAATMVAFGTSLPELTTAIIAVRKGHPEIVVGNVIGADVLNCLFVIGAAATAAPLAIPANFYTFHFPTMLIMLYSMRLFIAFNRNHRFYSWQGIWMVGIYLTYVILQYTTTS